MSWGRRGVSFDVVVGNRHSATSQMDTIEMLYRKIGMPRPLQIHVPTEAEERRYAGLDYRTPLGGTYIYDDSRRVWVGSETFLEVGPSQPGHVWAYGADPGKAAHKITHTYVSLPISGKMLNKLAGMISGVTEEKPAPPPLPSALWDNPTHLEEEIIGWRGWDYDSTILDDGTVDVYLQSLHRGYDWKNVVQWSDAVPNEDNQSGLYATGNEPRHRENFDNYVDGAAVWGRVALSGMVVEGKFGYRAQRMVIQDLWVNPVLMECTTDSAAGLALHLAKRYECPVSIRAPDWKLIERKLLPKGESHGEVAQGTEED